MANEIKAYFGSRERAEAAYEALAPFAKVAKPEPVEPVNNRPWLVVVSLDTDLGLSQKYPPAQLLQRIQAVIFRYDGETDQVD